MKKSETSTDNQPKKTMNNANALLRFVESIEGMSYRKRNGKGKTKPKPKPIENSRGKPKETLNNNIKNTK